MGKLPAIAFAISLALLLSLFGCASAPIKEGVAADGRPYRGAANPKVVIYEYSDFECPFCGKAEPTVEDVLRAYPETVQLQYRHFPLDAHPRSVPAAIASVCAQEQGKFWQMHDKMFANQQALEDADLAKYAQEIGLDSAQYGKCIALPATAEKVEKDRLEGIGRGVSATPMFFIGESEVRGAQPFAKFKSAIDSELARAN